MGQGSAPSQQVQYCPEHTHKSSINQSIACYDGMSRVACSEMRAIVDSFSELIINSLDVAIVLQTKVAHEAVPFISPLFNGQSICMHPGLLGLQ